VKPKIPPSSRLAMWWHPGLAIAIAKASWDHLVYPWIPMDIQGRIGEMARELS
jgi:hypothetical protein